MSVFAAWHRVYRHGVAQEDGMCVTYLERRQLL